MLAEKLKRIGHRIGIEVGRYRPASARRIRLIRDMGVKTVIDVGANIGQYAAELRSSGYDGTILSFEPLAKPFSVLLERSRPDNDWQVFRLALGDNDGEAVVYIASNVASSSLLVMRREHQAGAPDVTTIGTETSRVARLDALNLPVQSPAMLKLDVQGYEDRVLDGGAKTLHNVALIECELSLDELYEGQPTFRDMIDLLGDRGFKIIDLDPFFYDKKDGRVMSVDAMFKRE